MPEYVKGVVECNVLKDTVLFGGIELNNFIFGSCFGELNFEYPERYA